MGRYASGVTILPNDEQRLRDYVAQSLFSPGYDCLNQLKTNAIDSCEGVVAAVLSVNFSVGLITEFWASQDLKIVGKALAVRLIGPVKLMC